MTRLLTFLYLIISFAYGEVEFDHLKSSTIQGGISTGINLVLSKDEPKDTLKQGGLNIAANTLCGYGASKIGANLGDNPIIQTMTHFVSGGTAGYILNQSSKGFMSGAIGASVAKMTMHSLQNSALEQEKELNDKAKNEGKSLSFEERKANLKTILDKQIAISQITSASVASLLDLDPDLASHTSNTTAINNCEPASMALLYAGWVLTSTYASMVYFDVMEALEKEGVGAALERLGWEGTICATTLGIGEIVKVGEKAFRIAGKLYKDAPQAWNAIKSQINKWGKLVRGERVKPYRITDKNVHSSLPVGSKGNELKSFINNSKISNNQPTNIGGRDYSGHAIDRMMERGVPPSVVENTIKNFPAHVGNDVNALVHYDPINNISVVVNKDSGKVITTSFGVLRGVK